MLDLFKTSKEQEFSSDYFKTIVKNYVPKGIDKEINEYIEQGKTIDLANVAQVLPIEKITMWAYDRGFDRDALINNYTIKDIVKDIDENSNAYKSGLRNRDIVIKYDFPKWGSPDQKLQATQLKASFNLDLKVLIKKIYTGSSLLCLKKIS